MKEVVDIPVLWRSHSPHEIGPRPTKLEIPGWAGEKTSGDGAKPQPWHCMPWVEASIYGIELVFPWEEFRISTKNNKLIVEGNEPRLEGHIPFKAFAPGHYGFGSGLDIQVPPNHILRLEPHPRYFVDTTGTVPLLVPGHLQTEWWTRTFFIVFKMPPEGQTHIFRKNEGYGQAFILPQKVKYDIARMTDEQAEKRIRWERISYFYDTQIGRKDWTAHDGHRFNDKYKVMAHAWKNGGEAALEKLFSIAAMKAEVKPTQKKIKNRLVKRGKP
jgi:hypothetical protein